MPWQGSSLGSFLDLPPTLTGFGVHSKLCSFVEGSSEFGGAPDPLFVVVASNVLVVGCLFLFLLSLLLLVVR